MQIDENLKCSRGTEKEPFRDTREFCITSELNSSLMPCQKYVTVHENPAHFWNILAIHTKCPTSQNSDDSFMPPWNAVSSKSKNLCLAKLFNENKLLSSLWKRSYIIRKQRARGLNFWSRFQAVPQICMMADTQAFCTWPRSMPMNILDLVCFSAIPQEI